MVRVKICGVTREADVIAAAEAGADAIGFNFYSGSPRHVQTAEARTLVRALPPFVDGVAVFVNEPLSIMKSFALSLGLQTIQAVGETPEVIDPSPQRLIAAFRIRERSDLNSVFEYVSICRAADCLPAAVLIDAHVDGVYGGTGQVTNWELLDGFDPGVPWILAGGLTPENVAAAVRRLRPWAVDVASGVEASPGVKDMAMVRKFVHEAKSA